MVTLVEELVAMGVILASMSNNISPSQPVLNFLETVPKGIRDYKG